MGTGSQRGAAGADGAVDVRDLHVLYREKELLRGVSSTFRRSAVSAIVGPTGCGKTTLLRSINRMHDSTPGMPSPDR